MSFRFVLMLWCLLGLLPATAGAASVAAPPTAPAILVLGDSISAGYGLDAGQGWVSLLDRKLKSQGLPHKVVNASVSGETAAGGLARLPGLLARHQPKIVLVELGGNDGLRALPVKALRTNLEQIVDLSRKAGAQPVLFEMRIPSNYGAVYAEGFFKTFGEVAQEKNAALVPFFLLPIAADSASFQDDGIHPTAEAQPKMLDAIWPTLQPLLTK